MNKLSNRSFTIIAIAAIGLFGLTLMAVNQRWFVPKKRIVKQDDKPEAKPEKPLPEGWVEVGGVRRPMTDVERKRKRERRKDIKGYDPGRSPAVDPKTNANTKSVYEARGKPELAYRFTSSLPAPKFDRKAYEADPQKYLDEVAPGRINQSLPASKEVAAIKRDGKYIHQVVQGESVKLSVKIEPGMPVTFHSDRLGQFENQLTSITVSSGDDGIASTNFKLSGGTRGEIDVRAASPVHSDVARWLIEVIQPSKPLTIQPDKK